MARNFDELFDEPPGAHLIGQTVGPYRIERLLADSLYCQVYVARDDELQRQVAIKLLKSGPWLTETVAARFRQEGRLLAKLRHPHVITLFGIHSVNSQPCLVFEYVRGGTLADRLRETPVDPREAVQILSQIVRGLAAAHRQRVVHRDLKPQNVLLDDDVDDPDLRTAWGSVKVTDFGIAKILDDFESLTLTGTRQPGTPVYMAPEQIEEGRRGQIGMPTDVHALGLLAYQLLSGRNPFEAASIPQSLQRIVSEQPASLSEIVPGIPGWLNDCCMKCLEKPPEARYATADEVARALAEGLQHRTTISAPATVGSQDLHSPQTAGNGGQWTHLPKVIAFLTLLLLLIAAVIVRVLRTDT